MPIQIQIQGAEMIHQEVQAPLEDGTVGTRHLIIFHDPISGLGIQTIFSEDEARVDEEGNIVLLKQTRSDLTIAGAGDMPPPPGQNGPPQRPPMAGRGRPSR